MTIEGMRRLCCAVMLNAVSSLASPWLDERRNAVWWLLTTGVVWAESLDVCSPDHLRNIVKGRGDAPINRMTARDLSALKQGKRRRYACKSQPHV
jgi:hypothetical protein